MKKACNIILFLLIIPYFFLSCFNDDDSNSIIQTLWINDHKESCTGEIEQLCYLVQFNEEFGQEWEYFYEVIENFENVYEEGFIYQIKVERKKITTLIVAKATIAIVI